MRAPGARGSGPPASQRHARGERTWRGATGDVDDAAAALLAWLARDYLHHFTDRADAWLDDQERWPAAVARSPPACPTTWCR